jgi:3-oxoacyl-[acyl-carrier-protein] synthase II
LKNPISITSIASISAIGSSEEEIWQNYLSDKHFLSKKEVLGKNVSVGQLSEIHQQKI